MSQAFKIEASVTLVKQKEVIDYLRHKRCKSTAASLIEELPCKIGLKGNAPEFISMKTVRDLIHSSLVREMECDIVQYHTDINEIYVF